METGPEAPRTGGHGLPYDQGESISPDIRKRVRARAERMADAIPGMPKEGLIHYLESILLNPIQ